MASTVSICVLFPDLLGTYGDGGNATVLAKRLEWRDIPVERVDVAMGGTVPEGCDIYLMGGGEDQPQTSVTEHLAQSGALRRAVDNGAVVLAVCAGMQVLGASYEISGGRQRAGLDLLDVSTVRGAGARRVGELVVETDASFGGLRLTGYENHGGVTRLGHGARRLGTVATGAGNDDGQGSEGAVTGKVVGTYLHGPALARNAAFADLLLEWATGSTLAPLDDGDVEALRNERFAASSARGLGAGAPGGRLGGLARRAQQSISRRS